MAQSLSEYAKGWFRHTNKAERIWLMAKIEFKLRYYENTMGLLWALMKPVADVLVYYVAFKVILGVHTENYVPYVFLGIILFNYFGECTGGTVQILQVKRYLYEYTNMDKLEIYLSVILSNFIGLLFNLVIFLIFCQFVQIYPDYRFIYLIPLFLNLTILALAFSLILSNLYLLAKDINQLWAIVVNVLFWLSPIIYPEEKFHNTIPMLEYVNPIGGIIINCRNVLMNHTNPDWKLMGFDLIYAVFFLLIGLSLLKNLGPNASEKI
ncbi:MAG TPA: ABC transporter permease [Bacteroidia bacterium]|jgi:ABC-type polysaccharide/polyol phosphate export permease|nr:ABC transporter permease [Bacteroidia bacterium]